MSGRAATFERPRSAMARQLGHKISDMDKTFIIAGMRDSGCVTRITRSLSGFADKVQVTLEPPQAVLRGVHDDASLEVMQIALAGAGRYTMTPALPAFGAHESADTGAGERAGWLAVHKPLLLIFAFLAGVTWLIHVRALAEAPGRSWREWLPDFLAGYFLVFSFVKLLNLRGFVQAFQGYDLIAARLRLYALAYPFAELVLAVAYLLRWQPQIALWSTLALMLVSAAGVAVALRKRQLVESATLGTVFKLPLSPLTLVEMLGIAAISALMLSPV